MWPVFFIATACASLALAQSIPVDLSGFKGGPIHVAVDTNSVIVEWPDERERPWTAVFSLEAKKPLISSIAIGGKTVVAAAQPFYRCETGKRRGGWDAFFDFPPSAPEGTRSFLGEFHPAKASARSEGDRVIVSFDGMRLGIFEGSIRYVFYPGSRLIEQQAAMTTREPDVAYFYDAGLRLLSRADLTPGGTMNSEVSYFDTAGKFQRIVPIYGSERHPLAVRYRAIAARSGAGSVTVFAAPHQYMFARDYTTNMGYVWYTAWRGNVSLGIRQWPDDYAPYYPWMNAPPGTEQQMRMFFSVDDRDSRANLYGVCDIHTPTIFQNSPATSRLLLTGTSRTRCKPATATSIGNRRLNPQ